MRAEEFHIAKSSPDLSVMFIYKLIFYVGTCLVLVKGLKSRVVTIKQGPVKGYMAPESEVFVFYGIPYATTPTGTQKFQPPLPPPTWNETFEAVHSNIICPQNTAFRNYEGFIMQEDCLVANIYVPDTQDVNLPVYVYVHGGAFQFGHGTLKTPINLVKSKKIIGVNFNYRLGAHGFLCLGTKDIPGNAGMKDQVTLLKWLQTNIARFGGNPNDITIGGCSAGGAAVDLLMVSKMARGLFHKVIPESGCNMASFTVQIDPIANAKYIARELNFTNIDDFDALETFYKIAPFELLYKTDLENRRDSSVVLAPCVESNIVGETFLDNYPMSILKSGDYVKLPMLFGISDMEGRHRENNFETWKDEMNANILHFLPQDLKFTNKKIKQDLAQKVKHLYFRNERVNENNILDYTNYFTDVMIAYGMAKTVKLQVEAGNKQIFLYIYAFADESTNYIRHTNIRGNYHCAQTDAVMDLSDESKLSQEYQNIKLITRDLWLNFITTGKPVPDEPIYPNWPPVGHNRSPYMLINRTLELKNQFLGHRAIFWDEIYEKHYRFPIKPRP